MDCGVAQVTVGLLEGYLNGESAPGGYEERMEPVEYLHNVFDQRRYEAAIREPVAELFFRILKYEKLLKLVLKDYYSSRTRRNPIPSNDYCVNLVLFYYAIFELNEENRGKMEDLMMAMNISKAMSLANFLKKSNFVSKLFGWAIQIWDINYVRQDILGSIQESTFVELRKGIGKKMISYRDQHIKEPTKPIEMEVLKRSSRSKIPEEAKKPVEKVPSPVKVNWAPAPRPPHLSKPYSARKLMKDRQRNHEKAKRLYEEAQKNAFRVANLPKKEEKIEPCKVETRSSIRQTKIPVHKGPMIEPKKTAAVILREGARIMKMEQDEIKRLEDIMRGAFNSEALKVLERKVQEEKVKKHLEDIEKKRLQCLLTYEEALLAKRKFMQKTKEGADELRKEKETWTKQLEEWRAEEQERIRESFERGKAYAKGAKEAVEHVREEKHRSAQEIMEESRFLKERWLAEKEEELKRKIQLIKEIKALQAFGLMKRKEATENVAASVGLLCEMTTEELKERLLILRMEIQEEIEKRREDIKQKKECRKAIVNGYRDLIEQHQEISNYRKEKKKLEQAEKKPRAPVKSSSVEALKKKLDQKRKERMKVTMRQKT